MTELYKKKISELIDAGCDCYWCCELGSEISKSEKLCGRSIDEERLRQWAIACVKQIRKEVVEPPEITGCIGDERLCAIHDFLIDKFELTEKMCYPAKQKRFRKLRK